MNAERRAYPLEVWQTTKERFKRGIVSSWMRHISHSQGDGNSTTAGHLPISFSKPPSSKKSSERRNLLNNTNRDHKHKFTVNLSSAFNCLQHATSKFFSETEDERARSGVEYGCIFVETRLKLRPGRWRKIKKRWTVLA